MNHKTLYFALSLFIALAACTNKKAKFQPVDKIKEKGLVLKDGMMYGLACEGCNDTFIVVIPTEDLDGKPLKFNVQKAIQNRKVIGRLEVGDWCAIKINAEDRSVADVVINADLLKGKWVHKVYPQEKENARALMLLEDPDMNVDSVIQSYMLPVERGFQLMRHGRASSIGAKIAMENEKIPVTYPAGSSYVSWKLVDGKIVFSESDSIIDASDPELTRKIVNPNCERDTCELVLLLKDSLQISYKGTISSYYRAASDK